MSSRARHGLRLGSATYVTAVLLAVAGCAAVAPAPDRAPPRDWQLGEPIQALAEREDRFRSLRSLARVSYSGPDGRGAVQEAILVQRPDQLRLETITYLGSVLIVTVNDREIAGYHPRDGVFLRGEGSKENLARYTQIPLELHEITRLLLGLPPVDLGGRWEQHGHVVVLPRATGKDVVTFGAQRAAPTLWQRFDGSGAVAMGAEFADYIETPAGPFPSTIVFTTEAPKRRLEIRYEQPEINPALPESLFSQQKPPNVKELPIEALGG
ncbi:MAG TPA: DUF4292 domain-containing protein [Candidatus Eisenbacteria bacterium]|nr:DUF4292 domain-containing protein [Candidatus Eisenbacteria bacterium]